MDKSFRTRLANLEISILDDDRGAEVWPEIHKLLVDYREALEAIAYPVNHPYPLQLGCHNYADEKWGNALRNWHQATAANALTNGGK